MGHVIITGAGPAGASLAYLLSKHGVEVTLLERRRDFDREFRGEILMPSGIAALEQMGLSQQLTELPSHSLNSAEVFLNARPVLALDAASLAGVEFKAISQPALLEMLVREAGQTGSTFRFERGASLHELLFHERRVTGVRAKLETGEVELKSDLVIGADGRNSAVRRMLGLKQAHVSPPMDIVWCKIPCPADWNGLRAYLGRGHLLVAYHTWDGMLQLGWVILKGTFGELRSRGIEQWIDTMATHVAPDLAAHLGRHRDSIERPFLLNVVSDCVTSWCVPGALLIGDAAHAMSPVGGQGVNIALRDAVVAANHLVSLLAEHTVDSAALDDALNAVEAERMPEVQTIQTLQAGPPRLVLSRAWWGEPARYLIALILRSKALRTRVAQRVSVFPFGVTEVRLDTH